MSIKVLKADGTSLLKTLRVSTNPYTISNNGAIAYFRINIGVQYLNCQSMVTTENANGTPYNQISNISSSKVDIAGNLYVEISGNGFVAAHTFVLNILLYK